MATTEDDLRAALQRAQAIIGAQAEIVVSQARTISLLSDALLNPTPNKATRLLTSIGGHMGSISLSVDIANQVVSAVWADDKGDTQGVEAPAGAQITYTSSDPNIVTVDPTSGALTFNTSGQATLTATATDAGGNPVPGITPGTEDLTLTPGAASELLVSVGDGAPSPVPAGGGTTPSPAVSTATPATPTGEPPAPGDTGGGSGMLDEGTQQS